MATSFSPEQALEHQRLVAEQTKLEIQATRAKRRIVVDATIIVAVVTLIGVLVTGFVSKSSALDVQREQTRADLIGKGMDPANLERSKAYWQFLLENRIIEPPEAASTAPAPTP